MAFGDYFKGPKHKANVARLEIELQANRQQFQAELRTLRTKYEDLEAKAHEVGLLDLMVIKKQNQAEEARLANVQAQAAVIQSEMEAARIKLQSVQQQILGAEDTVQLESFALYEPKYQFTNSIDYKKRLDEIRADQKQTARGLSAEVDAWNSSAVELTKAEWKKLRKDALKLALRSFNSESEYCIDNVKFSNLEKMEERIRRSFESCNKLLKAINAWLTDIVLERKLQELYLAHEYQTKRQEEKEAARQAREDQREQERLEREIREARAKIDKERQHFTNVLQKLQLRLGAADDQQERKDLQIRIDEISSQNSNLDEEERLLDYREQNARAGYVYVISNIGAFGNGIYKIGMTRRLEPMDRVDELGDASVPFRFDVHALVFSDNAPALEAKLHSKFAAGRLNKVNGRKEFFHADLKEIEAVIRANYDAVVEVVHAAPAEQYRESLRLAMPVESIQNSERIALGQSA
jgi:predicted transport protein